MQELSTKLRRFEFPRPNNVDYLFELECILCTFHRPQFQSCEVQRMLETIKFSCDRLASIHKLFLWYQRSTCCLRCGLLFTLPIFCSSNQLKYLIMLMYWWYGKMNLDGFFNAYPQVQLMLKVHSILLLLPTLWWLKVWNLPVLTFHPKFWTIKILLIYPKNSIQLSLPIFLPRAVQKKTFTWLVWYKSNF